MLRIKTMVGKCRIYTLLSVDKWITLFDSPDGSRSSLASDTLLDAGDAHLQISSRIRAVTFLNDHSYKGSKNEQQAQND